MGSSYPRRLGLRAKVQAVLRGETVIAMRQDVEPAEYDPLRKRQQRQKAAEARKKIPFSLLMKTEHEINDELTAKMSWMLAENEDTSFMGDNLVPIQQDVPTVPAQVNFDHDTVPESQGIVCSLAKCRLEISK